jgi:secondary thiamine-phosphate synthase enzyme
MQEIRVRTERRTQLLDITGKVQEAVNGANGATAALVFVPHTTAGVTINEHADPAVARDFEAALERMVGDDWNWQHIEEGEENAPVALPRVADGTPGARATRRRPPRARHVAGHLLLRARRSARPEGLRHAAELSVNVRATGLDLR